MPKEYFAKKGNTRSGGGPFLQTTKTYGQGKNPILNKTGEITEHVLFRDAAIPSVEHSKTTYSSKSGLQISGHGSKTGDVTESGTSKTGTKTNVMKDSGKKRSAKWILENPNG